MPALIDVKFLNQVRVATIGNLMALDIKRHLGEDDNFKMEGDLLYFEARLYIPKVRHSFEFFNFAMTF
jgi:hypothetical protein